MKIMIWIIFLLLSIYLIFETVGILGLFLMFRIRGIKWAVLAGLASLIFFAAVVHFNAWMK